MMQARDINRKKQKSLFGKLPDEMVLTILSYGEMEDIHNTRVWQSRKVQYYTKTRYNWKAAANNNIDNLKWIYDFIGDTNFTLPLGEFKSDCYKSVSKSDIAVPNCTGKIDTSFLAFLLNLTSIIVRALHHGNFEMMEWLYDKGCFFNEWTFTFATVFGNLEDMMWLKLNGCPSDYRAFEMAADDANLEFMEFLKINDYPMDDLVGVPEEHLKDETIVQWFKTNGYGVVEGFGFYKGDSYIDEE